MSHRLAGQKGNMDKGINIERMERRPTVMFESTNSERRRRNRGIGCVCALVLMSCWLSDEMPYVTAAGRVWPHASNNFKRVGEHKMEILEISDMLWRPVDAADKVLVRTKTLWWEGCFLCFFFSPKDHSQDLVRKIRPVFFAFLAVWKCIAAILQNKLGSPTRYNVMLSQNDVKLSHYNVR